jgi:hypothetical protein
VREDAPPLLGRVADQFLHPHGQNVRSVVVPRQHVIEEVPAELDLGRHSGVLVHLEQVDAMANQLRPPHSVHFDRMGVAVAEVGGHDHVPWITEQMHATRLRQRVDIHLPGVGQHQEVRSQRRHRVTE